MQKQESRLLNILNQNTLRHMDYQIFNVKSLEGFDYFAYGNFGFIEPKKSRVMLESGLATQT
ncbi:MAG: hypothetical protein JNJ40_12670 [Bacteroidia bacterium]|nr:hypothetical protein [Bacteroidia bacterium]